MVNFYLSSTTFVLLPMRCHVRFLETKTRVLGLLSSVAWLILDSTVLMQSASVTDGRTDGHRNIVVTTLRIRSLQQKRTRRHSLGRILPPRVLPASRCANLLRLTQGRLSPYSNIGAIPPTRRRSKEGPGGRPPVCPTRSPKKIFVEYNCTYAVKIMLFYS